MIADEQETNILNMYSHKTHSENVTAAELTAFGSTQVMEAPGVERPLTLEEEQILADCAERITAIGRRSTAQAYEYGEELSKAQAILPTKKFGRWLKANAGISTKAAKNYTRVYNELGQYRERLEAFAVAPSALFALLGSNDEAIETVIGAFESGERPTVSSIKKMIGVESKSEKPPVVEMLAMPGRAACLMIAEQRLKTNIELFYELLGKVLSHVENAVNKLAQGKNVAMNGLRVLIEFDARHANDLFELTLAPLYRDEKYQNFNWKASNFGKTSPWGRLQAALDQIGGFDSWPKKDAFRAWIEQEIYPLLKFAVRGEPIESPKAETVVQAVDVQDWASIQDEERKRAIAKTRVRLDFPVLNSKNVVDFVDHHHAKVMPALVTD